MEEKILAILMGGVKNSTFSPRTFKEAATAMAKTATTLAIEEDKLETFVKDMLPLFGSFQGDANNQIAKAVKEVTPSKKEEEKNLEDTKTPKGTDAEAIAKAIADANKPLLDKIESFETTQKNSALTQSAKSHLMSHYKLKENMCDMVLGRVKIEEGSTLESIAKNAVEEYNSLAAEFGQSELTDGVPGADNTPTPPSTAEIDAVYAAMGRG